MKNVINMAAIIGASFFGSIAPAFSAGYDAGQYQQSGGQVMQQGSARFAQVMGVRAIQIEAAPKQGSQMQSYATMGAGTALGGVLGNSIDKPGSSGRQVATVLGGLLGAFAGNAMTNSGPSMVDAVELTLVEQNNQITVIAQAGSEQFTEGEEVMVILMGSTTRVTRAPHRQNAASQAAPAYSMH